MFARTTNPNYINADSYIGIKVCKPWQRFENFKKDMYESYLTHSSINNSRNTTLDRIDVYKGYSAKNCRWATQKQQGLNKKNTVRVIYKGLEVPLMTLSEEVGVKYSTIRNRLKCGYSIDEAVNYKLWQGNKKLI